MQSYAFSVCKQCRLALSRQFHTTLPTARVPKRQANTTSQISSRTTRSPYAFSWESRSSQNPPASPTHTELSPAVIRKKLLRNLPYWKVDPDTIKRLTTLGLDENEAKALLDAYEPYVTKEIHASERTESQQHEDPWGISHLLSDDQSNIRAIVNRALTMCLFRFASQRDLSVDGVRPESMQVLSQAYEALDLRFPGEVFTAARSRRRKVYLHVGPTNSGKTYNALRALATAKSGVYAGPLRLLAHEVWERLNRGSIRPHDVSVADAHKYARECNLITGEEQRIVSAEAALISCTVEMVNLARHYSVCVIDEIQMIADSQRGNSWTAATLGVSADEVHLCGEEAAVPLIEALMRETGDELIIKNYQRLTPLAVADTSLEGRLDRIQKGDCIVTFSRSSIFALKRLVEEATGLRCAVAYGRLPPETRSEQAALFNDPDSGYDVMVASDAIGMGLNLKIKRVVFVQLTKYNGTREVSLSLSQIKQIGGRAGRFGTHGDASSVGTVTCLNQNDLPLLAKAFATQPSVLRRAVVPFHSKMLGHIAQYLPPTFGLKSLYSLLTVASILGKNYCLPGTSTVMQGMEIIDLYGSELRLVEKMHFAASPTSWRAEDEVEIFSHFLRQYVDGSSVDLRQILEKSDLLYRLEAVNDKRKQHAEAKSGHAFGAATGYDVQTIRTLAKLETLHKVLINYIWLAFRMPMSFGQSVYATDLKDQTEKGIEFVLEGIESVRRLKTKLRRDAKTLGELRAENTDGKIAYTRKTTRIPRKLQVNSLT